MITMLTHIGNRGATDLLKSRFISTSPQRFQGASSAGTANAADVQLLIALSSLSCHRFQHLCICFSMLTVFTRRAGSFQLYTCTGRSRHYGAQGNYRL